MKALSSEEIAVLIKVLQNAGIDTQSIVDTHTILDAQKRNPLKFSPEILNWLRDEGDYNV